MLAHVVYFWINGKSKLQNLQNGYYLLKYNAIQTHKNKQIHRNHEETCYHGLTGKYLFI